MESVKELLSDPLKGTTRAQGVLCYLFRDVLLWKKFTTFTWNKRVNLFFEKPHNSVKPDKGNLNKLLKADSMMWNGFVKAIDFLNPAEATFFLKYQWGDAVKEYSITIDPLNPEIIKEEYSGKYCNVFSKAKPPQTAMAKLFRHIVTDLGYTKESWDQKFEEFLNNPVNTAGDVQKSEVVSSVNTLKRALMDGQLSWNSFRRGILIMAPDIEEYRLELIWTKDPKLSDIKPTVHTAVIQNPYKVKV